MKMKALVLVIFSALVIVSNWVEVTGHGHMVGPFLPRNGVHTNFCPHCANGVGPCGEGNGSQWVANTIPSQLDGTYRTNPSQVTLGSMIDVSVSITAAHRGHFVMELCRPTGNTITENCFSTRLERDPSDTRFSPFVASDPTAFFFMEDGCMAGRIVQGRFIIPAAFGSCDHCILRWYWQTGNSCGNHPLQGQSPPSAITSWRNGNCKTALSPLGSCGSNCPNSSCRNEQFKNCVDVRLVAPSGSATTTRPPVITAPTTTTTRPPVTAAPTTRPPVTAAPTTRPPVTAAPTTRPPVTAAPTTRPPVTAAPATTTTRPPAAGSTTPCSDSGRFNLSCSCQKTVANLYSCSCARV